MEIVISKVVPSLRRFLEKSKKKYSYIYFGQKDAELEGLLKNSSHKEIDINNCSKGFREEFFRAYLELIGQMGSVLNSLYWWASFTASKNRFISKLLPSLFLYYSICKSINENPEEDILLINAPRPVLGALRLYCRERTGEFRKVDYFLSDFYRSIKKDLDYFLRIAYFLISNCGRIFLSQRLFRGKVRQNREEAKYYALRTWVYPSSLNGDKYCDSFFGRLPEYLSSKGENLLIVAGIINGYKKNIKRISKCKDYLIIPQEYFLNYSDVVKTILECYRQRMKLNEIKFYGLDVTEIIQGEIDRDYRKYMRTNLLQKYIIRNILKYFKIHTFATTYENNPWERICFLSLREYSPSTKIIGYQHAVISKASANMFTSEKDIKFIPMPDRIITVGKITKDIMEKYGYYPKGKIHPSCALRHEYIYRLKRKNFIKNYTILIALEGIYDCYKLVNFVYAAMQKENDFTVIIRTHPERPFDKIKGDLCFEISSQMKFSVSEQKPLKDDLTEASVLIYWGSTVSMEALMMGIPVVHVDLGDMISVDPLFECNNLKWTVRNIEELPNIIKEIYSLSDEDYAEQYEKARSYIGKYLQEVTDERLSQFVM